MEQFKDLLTEKYIKSKGFDHISSCIESMSVYLHGSSRVAKGLSKELGKGYLDDFKEMQKHIDEIDRIWNDIRQEVELQEETY